MATITGTEGNDVVGPPNETTGNDTINTLGGNDTITTSGGLDTVNAGSGNDVLLSSGAVAQGYVADLGDGDDFVYVATQINSSFNLGAGNDYVFLRPSTGIVDTVTLGSGRDIVQAGLQSGGTIVFTDFTAGAGGDSLQFPTWFLQSGQWWFQLSSVGQSGIGNPFAAGVAQLVNSAGGAQLQLRTSTNSAWTTVVTFQGTTAAQFHADNFLGWSPTGAAAPATTLNITEGSRFFAAIDTYGDDTINGTAAGGYIHYTQGRDTIFAGDGDDVITGTGGVVSGFKTIHGGGGNDDITINGIGFGVGRYGQPTGSTAWGLVYGGDGDDRVTGDWSADELYGDAGADNLNGSGGNDLLDGGTGNDTLLGGTDDDILRGGSGLDTLFGGSENDTLEGGADSDSLYGENGSDVLSGGAGADALSGGNGADLFRDTAANFNGDTILDFSALDRIIILDANITGFSFSVSGNVLSFTGGSLTLANLPQGTWSATAAAGGGVQLTVTRDVRHDFNGDGRSDVAWQNANGSFMTWQAQANGSFVANLNSAANNLDVNWRVAGVGDFNGDGKDDLLWRHSSGTIGQWQGQASGTFANTSGVAANVVDNVWSVVGVGDYNGDGRDDVLWRATNGEIGQWLAQPNGSFINNGGAAANLVDRSWSVVANGDFNGDGRADVLWRHSSGVYAEWQGTASGALQNVGAVLAGAAGTVIGSSDFNADGRDDVLMRASNGAITMWLGQTNGQFIPVTPTQQVLDLSWDVVAIGDYNGDGAEDVLWQHSSGIGAEWLGTGDGNFVHNGAIPTMDTSWRMQSPDVVLL